MMITDSIGDTGEQSRFLFHDKEHRWANVLVHTKSRVQGEKANNEILFPRKCKKDR